MAAAGANPRTTIIIPSTPLPGQKPITVIEAIGLVSNIGNFLIIIGPVILVAALVISGIIYASAGDNTGRVDKAKAWFKNAIIGGLIIFGTGVIINTIAMIISRQFFCQAGIQLNIFGLDFSRCFIK